VDFGPLITLGVIYFVLSMLGKLGKKAEAKGQGGGVSSPRPVPTRVERSAPATLDELLAEMRGELDVAREHVEPEQWNAEEEEEEAAEIAEAPYQRPEQSPTWNTPVTPGKASWNDPVMLRSMSSGGSPMRRSGIGRGSSPTTRPSTSRSGNRRRCAPTPPSGGFAIGCVMRSSCVRCSAHPRGCSSGCGC